MKPSRSEIDELIDQANEGHLASQLYLGAAYSRNGELGYNPELAEHWFRQAAQANDQEPVRRLARFLFDEGKAEAATLAEALGRKGDFYGQYLLGHMHVAGKCGMIKNREKALEQWEAAAAAGHISSEINALKLRYPRAIFHREARCRMINLAFLRAKLRITDPDNPAIYS